MGIAPLLLAGALLQTPAPTSAPFELELPDGYPAFQRADLPDGPAWVSLRETPPAQFELRHFLLAAPGARADLVAANLRRERWEPLMRGFGSEIKPWEGRWAGLAAAGHRIDYVYQDRSQTIVQRLIVEDDHLVIGTWEGDRRSAAAAEQALDSFVLPASWRPDKAPQFDEQRGLGPTADPLPPIGHFAVAIDATDPSWEQVGFTIEFTPADGRDPSDAQWRLPDGAVVDEATPTRVRYRLSFVDEEGKLLPRAGITPGPSCLAGLAPGWLALPASLASADGRYAAPAVSLTVRSVPHLTALSDVRTARTFLEEQIRVTEFVRRRGGGAWPIFALGYYQFEAVDERRVAIRRSAESPSPERPIRLLDTLTKTGVQLWSSAQPEWSVMTFPGAGDAVLGSVLVLDEGNRWLRDPLDAEWIDGSRRAGLARKLGYFWFGRQLAGRGHGAVFLEASLSEYAAWRLLEASGATRDAKAMQRLWIEAEQSAGPLPRPLSLMPREDLAGARRLMTRGALVWKAIEDRAGRATLDRILEERLARGGDWTTEDLRSALEASTDREWGDWFRQHVYGRALP